VVEKKEGRKEGREGRISLISRKGGDRKEGRKDGRKERTKIGTKRRQHGHAVEGIEPSRKGRKEIMVEGREGWKGGGEGGWTGGKGRNDGD
jgi:hypothetical protein